MIHFSGRGILLDIEGTTSSTHFVYEKLFPFVQNDLDFFLKEHWKDADVRRTLDLLAKDANIASLAAWLGGLSQEDAIERIRDVVFRLMEADAKLTGLKELQGLIWRDGYRKGLIKSHVYADVPPALDKWTKAGLDLRIFSSGSILAQKMFFTHTELGELEHYFRGHYDTTLGPKRVPASYAAIAQDMQLPPSEVLFLSDVVAELDAARDAQMHTGLVVRVDNAPIQDKHMHTVIHSFASVKIDRH